MTPKEAIDCLKNEKLCILIADKNECTRECSKCDFVMETDTLLTAYDMAIEAIKKVEDYKAQWIDDMDNPLEPLKLSSALDSEIFKMRYRMENKPKEINILDYTVIAALRDCLKRYSKGSEDK